MSTISGTLIVAGGGENWWAGGKVRMDWAGPGESVRQRGRGQGTVGK